MEFLEWILPLRQLPLGAELIAACPYGNTIAYYGNNLQPNSRRLRKQHRGVFELLLVLGGYTPSIFHLMVAPYNWCQHCFQLTANSVNFRMNGD